MNEHGAEKEANLALEMLARLCELGVLRLSRCFALWESVKRENGNRG